MHVVPNENKMFLLEMKASLLIVKIQQYFNRNVTSTPLHIFDKPWKSFDSVYLFLVANLLLSSIVSATNWIRASKIGAVL